MADDLPATPVPVDADLRHFPNMPLEVGRLRDSDIASIANSEAFRCAVLLWCAAWHQVPAGSLPHDDGTLARMAGLGRDLRTWRRLKPEALRGFQLFPDGRFYHRVICEKVIEGLNSTRHHEWVKACARVRKDNHQRRKQKLDPLVNPDRPKPLKLAWSDSDGTRTEAPGARTEREYGRNGMEGISIPRGAHTAPPLGTVPDSSKSPPFAARAMALGGPHAHDAVPAMVVDLAAKKRVQQ